MPNLISIKAPVRKEMEEFESYFKSTMKTKVPLLDHITNYILRRKGKQLRPYPGISVGQNSWRTKPVYLPGRRFN
jgi:geranylgeranyl pyrophosphate synthase